MTGSSAAALVGLMFVVISLVTGREQASSHDGISTFSTPTVLHFGAALLVSAILVAPWNSRIYPGVAVMMAGLYGIVYVLGVMFRTRRLRTYTADVEDWTWYGVLPFAAYGAILAGGIALLTRASWLHVIAAAVVLLIFIGIRNAWDIVTYLAATAGIPPRSD
jgi:hypothetical protein